MPGKFMNMPRIGTLRKKLTATGRKPLQKTKVILNDHLHKREIGSAKPPFPRVIKLDSIKKTIILLSSLCALTR